MSNFQTDIKPSRRQSKVVSRSELGRLAAKRVKGTSKRHVDNPADRVIFFFDACRVVRKKDRGHMTYSIETRKGDHISLGEFARKVSVASSIERADIEGSGLPSGLFKIMATEMDIPQTRLWKIIGIPKATIEKKTKAQERVDGQSGCAALAMIRLLDMAQSILEKSTVKEAKDFDTAKWFGEWIEKPQPALQGRKPSEVLDTPSGAEAVAKVLGAIESGAYL